MRQLQRRLYEAAKRSKTRRFHALYDRIYRSDVLWEAWSRVRSNRGAAGIDGETIDAIEQQGVEVWLRAIEDDLRAGEYHPTPVRRVSIAKPDGRDRPLGIPTVRDRVVQMATKIVVEPIFEADFRGCSYGFRPKRNATQALEAIRVAGNRGHNFVVDGDITSFFDSIDQAKLMELCALRISDRRVLKLIRKWLAAGVMVDGTVRETLAGTPQGGVISPLLANIYLDALDRYWENECKQLGILVRYADDFVVMCKGESLLTDASWSGARDVTQIIAELNPVLLGWGNYFRSGTADREFLRLDDYVYGRLLRWMWRRGGQRTRFLPSRWPRSRLRAMGLHQLRTTVQYPAQATPRRPSVSRVREIRTHGLNGSLDFNRRGNATKE